jgi:hypothetical protein
MPVGDVMTPDPDIGGTWMTVAGRLPAEGGYTDGYELVCCDCGGDPDLDYRDVSARLQRVCGPYSSAAGITAYGRHVRLQHGQSGFPGQARSADENDPHTRAPARSPARPGR